MAQLISWSHSMTQAANVPVYLARRSPPARSRPQEVLHTLLAKVVDAGPAEHSFALEKRSPAGRAEATAAKSARLTSENIVIMYSGESE